MVVAMASTRNWYHYLCVDIFSLLSTNNCISKIYVFSEDDDIKDIEYLEDIKKVFNVEIKVINFNKYLNRYINKNSPNYNTIYSNFAFCKLFLADFVKEDNVLYIDVDAIVVKDISILEKLEMNEFDICGCLDYGVMEDDNKYFKTLKTEYNYINSGFFISNLKSLKNQQYLNNFKRLLNEKEFKYPDQDVLNIICNNKKIIHSMFNFAYLVTLEVKNLNCVKCYHFAGPKNPWLEDSLYAEIWYEQEEKYYKFIKDKIN